MISNVNMKQTRKKITNKKLVAKESLLKIQPKILIVVVADDGDDD